MLARRYTIVCLLVTLFGMVFAILVADAGRARRQYQTAGAGPCLISPKFFCRSGGLILTPWPAGVGDEDGENHPEERHKQADDREAACEHSGLPQCRGECPHASEPALRWPFI